MHSRGRLDGHARALVQSVPESVSLCCSVSLCAENFPRMRRFWVMSIAAPRGHSSFRVSPNSFALREWAEGMHLLQSQDLRKNPGTQSVDCSPLGCVPLEALGETEKLICFPFVGR